MNQHPPTSDELILRDRLALDRTHLANERTLLAYIRTAFMLAIAGATALKLFTLTPVVAVAGWSFVGLGIAVAILGAWRFVVMRQSINRRTGAEARDCR